MTNEVDCQVFEDQLDALIQGALPEEGLRQLRIHARSCPSCALQLRLKEHLVRPSLEELEARVPEELVSTMWDRLQEKLQVGGSLSPGPSGRSATARPSGRRWRGKPRSPAMLRLGWALPAMAAATVVLLAASGYLFAELQRVTDREQALAERLVQQTQRLGELEARTDAVARASAISGRGAWARVLSRTDRITVAELEEMLRSAPGTAVVLNASQVEALVTSPSPWAPAAWKLALASLEGRGDLSVSEVLALLEAAALDPGTALPTSRLTELLN